MGGDSVLAWWPCCSRGVVARRDGGTEGRRDGGTEGRRDGRKGQGEGEGGPAHAVVKPLLEYLVRLFCEGGTGEGGGILACCLP